MTLRFPFYSSFLSILSLRVSHCSLVRTQLLPFSPISTLVSVILTTGHCEHPPHRLTIFILLCLLSFQRIGFSLAPPESHVFIIHNWQAAFLSHNQDSPPTGNHLLATCLRRIETVVGRRNFSSSYELTLSSVSRARQGIFPPL